MAEPHAAKTAGALPQATDSSVDHMMLDVGEVKLHVTSQGSGRPVVLLHGFPEFWWSWRFQMPALAQAGYRAVAPDMRGYNSSDKPARVADYGIDHLVADVRGLVRAIGADKIDLVAHDWGGAVAWYVAALAPELVDRLVILNAPHPTIFLQKVRLPDQLKMSWYMFFFQLPRAPERFVTRPGAMARTFRGWTHRKEHFDREVTDRFQTAICQPGAATGAIHYYRAAMRQLRAAPLPEIHAKTMVVWGMDDRALGPWMLDGLEEYVRDLRIERIEDASHWVQQDAPERVNELLLDFLKR